MTPEAAAGARLRQGLILAVLLSLAWGLFWPVMKVALGGLPLFSFRIFTAWAGAAGLFLLARLARQSLAIPPGRAGPLLIASFFNVTAWFYLSALGVLLMPAGRASLLAYTMPLWAFLLSLLWLGERPTGRRLLGLALGLGGIVVLAGEDLLVLGQAPLGALTMIGAAIAYGAGTVYQKRVTWNMPVISLAAWQLFIGGAPLAIAAGFDDWGRLLQAPPSALLAAAYVVLVGVIFGMYAWFRIIELLPISLSSIATLFVPVIGVGSSALLLGEAFGPAEVTAAVLIVGALATTLPGNGGGVRAAVPKPGRA